MHYYDLLYIGCVTLNALWSIALVGSLFLQWKRERAMYEEMKREVHEAFASLISKYQEEK